MTMTKVTNNTPADTDVDDAMSMRALHEFLLDMELGEMCDELGITGEHILDRFKDLVYTYRSNMDRDIDELIHVLYEEEGESTVLLDSDTLAELIEDEQRETDRNVSPWSD